MPQTGLTSVGSRHDFAHSKGLIGTAAVVVVVNDSVLIALVIGIEVDVLVDGKQNDKGREDTSVKVKEITILINQFLTLFIPFILFALFILYTYNFRVTIFMTKLLGNMNCCAYYEGLRTSYKLFLYPKVIEIIRLILYYDLELKIHKYKS